MNYFLIGLLFGGILVGVYFNLSKFNKHVEKPSPHEIIKDENWTWPDSLDALIAAKDFHKLIYQTPEFRILEVTIEPGKLDPVHTHKGKSIVWVVNSSPIVYNTFGLDNKNNFLLIKQDTIIIKPEELNIGTWEKPEPPHSVENIGKDLFKLYRIEFNNKPE